MHFIVTPDIDPCVRYGPLVEDARINDLYHQNRLILNPDLFMDDGGRLRNISETPAGGRPSRSKSAIRRRVGPAKAKKYLKEGHK